MCKKSIDIYFLSILRFGTSVFPYLMPVVNGLLHVARTGSVYVTMAVTMERYFAIVHPLKDFKMKKALLPMATGFALLYNLPKVCNSIVIVDTLFDANPKFLVKKMYHLLSLLLTAS